MEITIKKAGLIYVVVVLALAGAYFSTLSPQEDFLRDLRWVSDKSAINLATETDATALYVYTTADEKVFLSKGYKIINNIIPEPIGSQEEYTETLEKFRQAALDNTSMDAASVNGYFQGLAAAYTDSETQYNAAIVDVRMELTIQRLEKLAPNIPPIVVETQQKTVEAHALAVNIDDLWRVKMFGEIDGDGYVVTDLALERYIK